MGGAAVGLPPALEAATAHQPAARLALADATGPGGAHAYLFAGPRGAGKAAAARALAAELLASGSSDPESARRRALADPSPHPDLVWVSPPGTQHLVEEVRERVIRQAAYRPFENERRVFVIDEAEGLREESQNALLKTLEEPPAYARFILVTSEPGSLLETVASRCRQVSFRSLPSSVLVERIGSMASGAEGEAAARLARGDERRARLLLSPEGRTLRERAEGCARAARAGNASAAPLADLLADAGAAGEARAREILARIEGETGDLPPGREASRMRREAEELAKRVERRVRTDSVHLALELIGLWFRDLGCVLAGAEELCFAVDRLDELRADARGLDPASCEIAVERANETRRRLALLNVTEDLALDALLARIALACGSGPGELRAG